MYSRTASGCTQHSTKKETGQVDTVWHQVDNRIGERERISISAMIRVKNNMSLINDIIKSISLSAFLWHWTFLQAQSISSCDLRAWQQSLQTDASSFWISRALFMPFNQAGTICEQVDLVHVVCLPPQWRPSWLMPVVGLNVASVPCLAWHSNLSL